MTERLVFGLAGYSGTGKTTISNHLANKGIVVEEGSGIIRDAAAKRGRVPTTRQEYEEAFRTEQKYRGMTWLSDSILARAGTSIMQAGLRAKPDFLNLKKHGGLIIALVCPIEVCLARIDSSNPKNSRTVEEYLEHQAIENNPDSNGFGSYTQWCVENADHRIDTSQSLDAVLGEVEAITLQ